MTNATHIITEKSAKMKMRICKGIGGFLILLFMVAILAGLPPAAFAIDAIEQDEQEAGVSLLIMEEPDEPGGEQADILSEWLEELITTNTTAMPDVPEPPENPEAGAVKMEAGGNPDEGSESETGLSAQGVTPNEDGGAGAAGEEDSDDPLDDIAEYDVPEGSAYIYGYDTIYYNNSELNAISQAIEAAIKLAQDDISELTIIISNGVYLGDIIAKNDNQIHLKIIAADAYHFDASGEMILYGESAGGVHVEGAIITDGLSVTIAGIHMSLQELIEIRNADLFTYYGTSIDERVTFDLTNVKSFEINGGDGNNEYTVNITQGSTPLDEDGVDPGALPGAAGNAAKEADEADKGTGSIILGDGNNFLNVNLHNSTQIELEEIESEDEDEDEDKEPAVVAKGSIDAFAMLLSILLGSGSNEVNISGTMSNIDKESLDRIIKELEKEKNSNPQDDAETKIIITSGGGDTLVNVDTSVAFSNLRGVTVEVVNMEGFSRVHLTGVLDENADEPINGDSGELMIQAQNDEGNVKSLTVKTEGVNSFTDTLENKKTIEIDVSNPGAVAFMSFINYVLDPVDSEALNYTNITGAGSFLTNLVIKGTQITLGNIYVPNINILVLADNGGSGKDTGITVTGDVRGKNIIVIAKDDNAQRIDILEIALVDEDGEELYRVDLFDIVSNVYIIITKDARLTAEQAVSLSAISLQTAPLIPSLEELTKALEDKFEDPRDINFIAIKISKVLVEILGSVEAAAIRVVADNRVKAETAEEELDEYDKPLAIVVIIAEAVVTVGGEARLTSTLGGVHLRAASEVYLNAAANSGVDAPVTAAISVVINNAYVEVGGRAIINSETDTSLNASGRTSIQNDAAGSNREDSPEASNGFFAVNVTIQDVLVSVAENASVLSGRDIMFALFAAQRIKNTAASNPGSDGNSFSLDEFADWFKAIIQGADNVTVNGEPLFSDNGAPGLIILLDKFFGSTSNDDDPGDDEDTEEEPEKRNGKGFLDVVNSASEGVPDGDDEEKTSRTQLAGAIAFTYAGHSNAVRINTNGRVEAIGQLLASSVATLNHITTADGSLVGAKEGEGTALGVGVAVSVIDFENKVDISSPVAAGSLKAQALTSGIYSLTTAKAGYSGGKFGLAGAIAVGVFGAANTADLNSEVTINNVDGYVEILSNVVHSEIVVAADALGDSKIKDNSNAPGTGSKPGSGDGNGVGAGIAVTVSGIDVRARLTERAMITPAPVVETDNINIIIDARFSGAENTIAIAGVSGGVSVAPSLALVVSGVSVVSDIENSIIDSRSLIGIGGDVNIRAESNISRNIIADAYAVGGNVGVGATVAVSILNDSASATLNRSMKGRSINVHASSVSRAKVTARAGANGAEPSEDDGGGGDGEPPPSGGDDEDSSGRFASGEADAVTDANINTGKKMAGLVNTANINEKSVEDITNERQKAETSEGNVQVAAALVFNALSNISIARIGDGISLTTIGGDISVTSANDTDAEIIADASSTNAEVGVGVAVAINTVTYDNSALVGNARLYVEGNLIVSAGILDLRIYRDAEEMLTVIYESLLEQLGLGKIAELKDFIDKIIIDRQGLYGHLEEAYLKHNKGADITSPETIKLLKELEELAVRAIIGLFSGNPAVLMSDEELELYTEHKDVVDEAVAAFTKDIKDLLNKKGIEALIELLVGCFEDMSTLLDRWVFVIKDPYERTKLLATMGQLLSLRFGEEEEPDGLGHRISTQAISGAGASKVGVAGSVAISIVNGTTAAMIESLNSALPNDADDIYVIGDIIIAADNMQFIYTTAGALANAEGKADKNKSATDSGGENQAINESADEGKSVGIGASFALAILNNKTEAGIGNNRRVEAGSLDIRATTRNEIETASIAGIDPLPKDADPGDANDIAVDASVAITIVPINDVHAYVKSGTVIITNGMDSIEVPGEGRGTAEKVNLFIYALLTGKTVTNASGYAMGEETAVGAAVALNIAVSDVTAQFDGTGYISGAARVAAHARFFDDATAIAMAMGADVDRYLARFRFAQRLLSRDGAGSADSNGNATSRNINENVDKNSSEGSTVSNEYPLSTNLLSSQNASTPSTSTDTGSIPRDDIDDASIPGTGSIVEDAVGGIGIDNTSSSIQIAAAVALNIAKYEVKAGIGGELNSRSLETEALINGNSSTVATGAAFSVKDNSNAISAAVAISVNENTAQTVLDGRIVTEGNLTATAGITQNMDGVYRGRYTAMAISGGVSGSGGTATVAGALALVISRAKTGVAVTGNAVIQSGGDIILEAYDQTKLSSSAMAAAVSGAKVGVGASFAVLYAENTVSAIIESNAEITGKSLALNAIIKPVSFRNWVLPFGLNDILTENGDDNEGIVNVNTDYDNEDYKINHKISAEDFIKFAHLTSLWAAGVNYYASAISGSIMAGANNDSKLALAGAVTLLYMNGSTQAYVGDGAIIKLTGGDLIITAEDETNARLISSAVTVSNADVGIGANMSLIFNNRLVSAEIGKNVVAVVDGEVSIIARSSSNLWAIAVAAAAATGRNNTATVGGVFTFIKTGNETKARIGEWTNINAVKGLSLIAENKADLVVLPLSGAGSSGGVAVGAVVSVIITDSEALAEISRNVKITSDDGSITVKAVNNEALVNAVTALAVADGVAVSGIINVLITNSRTHAIVGEFSELVGRHGISIIAESDAALVTVQVAGAGSISNAAVGAVVSVNVQNRDIKAATGKNVLLISERGSVLIKANAAELSFILTSSGTAASGVAVSPNVQVNYINNSILAYVGDGSTIRAYDSIGVIAEADSSMVLILTEFALSVGSVSVGAGLITTVLKNQIAAIIGDEVNMTAYALLNGSNAGIETAADRNQRRKGIVVSSYSDEFILMGVAAITGSVGVSVQGTVSTLVIQNSVSSLVGKNTSLNSGARETDNVFGETEASSEGDVTVEAEDHSRIIDFAGSIAVSVGTAPVGVGATVAILVLDKQVTANAADVVVNATGNLLVSALAKESITFIGATFGAATGVAVSAGGNIMYFENDVLAQLGGTILAEGGVTVRAGSDTWLVSVAFAGAGAGSVAVSGAAAVTYFTGTTVARVLDNAVVESGGSVVIEALSKEFVSTNALGIAGSGTTSVSGAVIVVVTSLETKAYTGKNVVIKAGDLTIKAIDKYDLLGIGVSLAGAGTVAVGVTAVVTVVHNTITAHIGESNKITTASGDVTLIAQSGRNIQMYIGSFTGAGVVSVAATVLVAVIGGELDRDSADSIKKEFNAGQFESEMNENAPSVAKDYDKSGTSLSLVVLLEGEGESVTELEVGSGEEGGVFDGSGGYVDESIYDEYEDGDTPGADYDAGENKSDDIENASKIGATQPKYDPKDTTMAFIGTGSVITSARDITVAANDILTADLITATLAAAAKAGVGVGVAVALLYSNTLAYADHGTELSAGGDILIVARGASEQAGSSEGASELLDDHLDGKVNTKTYGIRVISVTGGVGLVGVSAAVAILIISSNVKAWLEGDVKNAANVTVHAESDYPQTLAATIGLAGGYVGVTASVALVNNNGNVFSAIVGRSNINATGTVTVSSDSIMHATSALIGVSGGFVGVTVALSLAINRANIETFIGQGVTINSGGVEVKAKVDVSANAYLAAGAFGAIAVSVPVAIANLSPTVLTYIGTTPYRGTPTSGASDTTIGIINTTGLLKVESDITTTAKSALLGISGGAIAANINVLLVYNDTVAYSGINKMNIIADSIDVDAYMSSSGESTSVAVTAGAIAAGVTVSYVNLNSHNEAFIDLTGVTLIASGEVNVFAGRGNKVNNAEAMAWAAAVSAGAISVNVNTAIADNETRNIAVIKGDGTLIALGSLNIGAHGNATVEATIWDISAGAINVAAIVVVSLLRSEQYAGIQGGHITASSLNTVAHLNPIIENSAIARIMTGGGGAISVDVSVAKAYGRSKNLAIVAPASLTISGGAGDVVIGSYGKAGTLTEIKEIVGINGITVSVMVGLAYAQSEFAAILQLPDGSTLTARNVIVETDYISSATSKVTPGAVSINLIAIDVNLAIAENKSKTEAALIGSGRIIASEDVKVKAIGEATATAAIITPIFGFGGITVAANIIIAKLEATQTARITGATISARGTEVLSELNNKPNIIGASATMGSNAAKDVSINLASIKANAATATANARSEAYVSNAEFLSGALTVQSKGTSNAEAVIDGALVDIGLVSIDVNTLYAEAKGEFSAYVETVYGKTMNLLSLTVETIYSAKADARTTQGILGVKAITSKVNVADAIVTTKANAHVSGNGSIDVEGDVRVAVLGNTEAFAGVFTPKVNINVINIAATVLTATAAAVQNAYIQGVNLVARDIDVLSTLNSKAEAMSGSITDGRTASIELVDAQLNVVFALAAGISNAYVSGANIGHTDRYSGLTVRSQGNVVANAGVRAADVDLNFASLGVFVVTANAAGVFNAGADTTGSVYYLTNLTVETIYHAKADARTTQGTFGISFIEGEVNYANALVETAANAYLRGNGTIDVDGDVKVAALGNTEAFAGVFTPKVALNGISIVVTILNATAKAEQNAYIRDLNLVARNIDVLSILNSKAEAMSGSIADGTTANITLVGAQVNAVEATATGTSNAYVSGANIGHADRYSGLTVRSQGNVVANAGVRAADVSAGLVSLGVLVVNADAAGIFNAWVDTEGKTLYVTNLTVESNYEAVATANATQPKLGLRILNGDVNKATAEVSTRADAYISGRGAVHATGAVRVEAIGRGEATAVIKGTDVSIAFAYVALNQVRADISAKQNAYIIDAKINASSVNVNSTFVADGYAAAGSNSSVNVSFVNGNMNRARATSDTAVRAYIGGQSIINATGAISINAASSRIWLKAESTANDVVVSLIDLSVVDVIVEFINDIVEAYITGSAQVTGRSVSVIASGNSDGNAYFDPPNVSINLIGVDVIGATAKVSSKTVSAYIGPGAVVISTGTGVNGNVVVDASSTISLVANIGPSGRFSAANLNRSEINATVTRSSTTATVNGQIVSEGGIRINARDNIILATSISDREVGLINGGRSIVNSIIRLQESLVTVGSNALLRAVEDIIIRAETSSYTLARVDTTSIGLLYQGGAITSNVEVTRKTEVQIREGASIVSRYGNVSIKADALTATINALAAMGGGGIIGAGNGPSASATLNSTTSVNIGSNVNITALFGDLEIIAQSNSNVYADARRNLGALGGVGRSEAGIVENMNNNENVAIIIGADPAKAQAYINARNTVIDAVLNQRLVAYGQTSTSAGWGRAYATATVEAENDVKVNVYNAFVGGIEKLRIDARIATQEIVASAHSTVNAVFGRVLPSANTRIQNNASVYASALSDLAGRDITITADAKRNLNIVRRPTYTRRGFVVREVTDRDYGSSSTGTITLNGRIHLGGGAAGIFIEVRDNGEVYVSGLDLLSRAEDIYTINHENKTITFDNIFNSNAGSLTLNAIGIRSEISGSPVISRSVYQPNIVISSYLAGYDLVIKRIMAENLGAGMPRISANIGFIYTFIDSSPALTINNYVGTNVTFAALLDFGEGLVKLNMTGGDVNTGFSSEDSIIIWANRLIITGAGSIGSLDNRFSAYILDIPMIPGIEGSVEDNPARPTFVWLEANDGIYASFTLIVGLVGEDAGYTSGKTPVLRLDYISAEEVVDIIINAPRVLKYEQTKNVYSVSLPGNRNNLMPLDSQSGREPVRILDYNGTPTAYYLTDKGLITIPVESYAKGSEFIVNFESDFESGYYFHLLPNNVILITNGAGRIVTVITPDGMSFDVSGIRFDENGNIVFIGGNNDIGIDYSNPGNPLVIIGEGGGTVYQAMDAMKSWLLADGTRIYYKHEFILNGEIIKTTVFGTSGGNTLLQLGSNSSEYIIIAELGPKMDFVEGYRLRYIGEATGTGTGTVLFILDNKIISGFNTRVEGKTIMHRGITFDLIPMGAGSNIYIVARGDHSGNQLVAYNDLIDKWFVFTENQDGTPVLRVYENVSEESYKSENGVIVFADASSGDIKRDNWDNIIYLENVALAVLTDNTYRTLSIINDEDGAIITYSPNMEQAVDEWGTPMFSKIQFKYKLADGNIKTFYSTGDDASYWDAVKELMLSYGVDEEEAEEYITAVNCFGDDDGDGKFGLKYDPTSEIIYDLYRHAENKETGKKLYYLYEDGEIKIWELSDDEHKELSKEKILDPVYEYIPGTVILRPIEAKDQDGNSNITGAYITYTEPMQVALHTNDGYGYISETMLINISKEEEEFPIGTILWLDKQGRIIAWYTPDGTYRIYTDGSFYSSDKAVYTELVYDNINDIDITFSEGTNVMLHEVITGVYMLPLDTQLGRESRYFYNDYFGYDSNGNLVQLYRSDVGIYVSDTEDGEEFNGFPYIAIYAEGSETPIIWIIEMGDSTTVFLLSDGTWLKSNGGRGYTIPPSGRETDPFYGDTEVHLQHISAKDINLTVRVQTDGRKTLTDDGTVDVNIIANNLTIIADNGVQFGTSANPLKAIPFSDNVFSVEFMRNASGADYGGTAYLNLLDGHLNFLDTNIAEGGFIRLTVENGDLYIYKHTVDGTLILDAAGSILMKDRTSLLAIGETSSDDTSLSAGRDIGSPGMYLRVDVAENRALNIIKAHDIHIIHAVLIGVINGKDRDGNDIDGRLLEYLGYQDIIFRLLRNGRRGNGIGNAGSGDDSVWSRLLELRGDLRRTIRYLNSLTDEELEELLTEVWKKARFPEIPETAPRSININIGSSSGAVYVENPGDVIVTVRNGDLTVGRIASLLGDVTLISVQGSILGRQNPIDDSHETYDVAYAKSANVYGENITLRAYKDIGSKDYALITEHALAYVDVVGTINMDGKDGEGRPWVVSRNRRTGRLTITFMIDYNLLMTANLDARGNLSALSENGSIYIRELTGDLSVGYIEAAETVELWTQGDIVNGTTPPAAGGERIRAANIVLHAGGNIASQDDPLLIAGGGTLSAFAKDIFISGLSDKIIVDTIRASGNVELSSAGSILDNRADNIAAAVEAALERIKLASQYRLIIEQISVLTAYIERLDALLCEDYIELQEKLGLVRAELEKAEQTLSELRANAEAIAKKIAELTGHPWLAYQHRLLVALIDSFSEYIKTIPDQISKEHDELQDDCDEIYAKILLAKQMLSEMFVIAEAIELELALAIERELAAKNAIGNMAIEVAGDLILNVGSGYDIGSFDNALSVLVGGMLFINKDNLAIADNIYIENAQGLVIGNNINASGNVRISSENSIEAASGLAGSLVTAQEAVLNSLYGDIGTPRTPLYLSVGKLSAMGKNVYIINDRDLEIGIIAGENVDVYAAGNITAGSVGQGESNIYAGNLNLRAVGDIGSPDARLKVDAINIISRSRNLFLHSSGAEMNVRGITVDSVADITADGNIGGGVISAHDITILAFGSVGTASNYLLIRVPGNVDISSLYGNVYYRNLLSSDTGRWEDPHNNVDDEDLEEEITIPDDEVPLDIIEDEATEDSGQDSNTDIIPGGSGNRGGVSFTDVTEDEGEDEPDLEEIEEADVTVIPDSSISNQPVIIPALPSTPQRPNQRLIPDAEKQENFHIIILCIFLLILVIIALVCYYIIRRKRKKTT